MNQLKIFNSSEKEAITNKLKKQFGVSKIPGILVKSGTERIFLFQGDLDVGEIKKLERTIPIERVGIYFGKEVEDEFRLSIDGIHILKDQITKGIFELTEEQLEDWMKGHELLVETGERGFFVMKYKDDFVGCGKVSEKKISNYIPKNRRLKEKS